MSQLFTQLTFCVDVDVILNISNCAVRILMHAYM